MTTPEPFTCDVAGLLGAIKRVKLGIDKKSALPILQGVHIRAGATTTTTRSAILTTTDMDVTVSTFVDGSGALDVVAPVVMLEKILGKLRGSVTLERDADAGKLILSAGSRTYSLQAFASDDYPQTVDDPAAFPCIPQALGWRDAWDKVKRSIGKDPTRIGLTRVSVDGRTVVATDSYRMSVHNLPTDHAPLPTTLVQGRACEIVAKLKGAVSFGIVATDRPTFSVFGADGVTRVSCRPVDEQYPNYRALLPNPADLMSATIDKRTLVDAIDAVAVVARKDNPRVTFAFSRDGKLELSAESTDNGSAAETLAYSGAVQHCRCLDPECSAEHNDTWRAGFNPVFLADGMAGIDGQNVVMSVSDPLRPAILRAADADAESLYLLMPIAIETPHERHARIDEENGKRTTAAAA